MSKILHSTTESYTNYAKSNKGKLGRGLFDKKKGEPFKTPGELAEHLSTEHSLVLRQTIAVLDKLIGKRISLTSITSDVYLHRVYLGEALWQMLRACFHADGANDEEIAALERKWLAKVHPYRRYDVDTANPSSDGNCSFLIGLEDEKGKRAFRDFLKKWGKAIWPPIGKTVDYTQIAQTIMDHLSKQELTIEKGAPREVRTADLENRQPTGTGLMVSRGKSASKSASDPRKPSKKLVNTWEDSPKRRQEKEERAETGGPFDQRPDSQIRYFEPGDVAQQIFRGVLEVVGSEERIFNAWFGSITYTHFGLVLEGQKELKDADDRKKLWNLHNAIRGYYKSLVTSQRFRITLRENAKAREGATYDDSHPTFLKLKALLPNNQAQLMARLSAGHENADMSEVIRLGKLLVHSAVSTNLGEADGRSFDEQISHLATSAGQGEIKRIETFARIWRQSSAVATRTLTGLTNMRENDVNDNEWSRAATARPLEHMRSQIPIIFGGKDVFQEGSNRASLFLCDDDLSLRENIWALVRLGAGIRDAVQHFNVRSRLLNTIGAGLLEAHDNPTPLERRNRSMRKMVTRGAFQSMEHLLVFDKEMRKETVRLQLEALNAHEFLDDEELKRVVRELGGLADFKDNAPPRFTSVINLVHALAENDDVVLHPDLSPLQSIKKIRQETEQPKDNMCRRGLFQLLYGSGFRVWFAEKAHDAKLYSEVVSIVIAQKNDRADQFERKVHRKTIPTVSEMADWLDWETHDTLDALLKELARRAIQMTDQDTRYRADPIIQSATANRIERFKQEVFAHLFVRYITDKKLLFIADIKDAQPTELDELRLAMSQFKDVSLEQMVHGLETWHARFYTWLYLVPPSEISMLRHQMKKSVALETKSPTETDEKAVEMLDQMDRLMALYTQVQAAGFSGTEHQGRLKAVNLLYEDQNGFEEVYSNESEDSDQTFAGTRRGLRQIVRYGDIQTLEPIFSSHRVSKAEVTTFTEMDPARVKKLFADFVKLRADIIKATKVEKPKRGSDEEKLLNALPANVAKYERDLLKVAHYNFHASAARLTDHVKLHHVLMSVVAKLTDYALMWERDKTFAYFGMLYRALEYKGLEPGYGVEQGVQNAEKSFGFKFPKKPLNQQLAKDPNNAHRQTFIKLIDDRLGFEHHFDERVQHLSPEDAARFKRAFIKVESQNPHDIRAEKLAQVRKETTRPFKGGRFQARATIRNELTHLEVIRDGKKINLTYLMNAVRSLMAYDQKQKNAVVKSVKRILNDYGLQADWRIKEDRLTRPDIYPLAEKHLKMLHGNEFEGLRVFLPRASVRLTSMVHALFDFGTSGLGIKHPRNAPQTITLNYPPIYFSKTGTKQYEPTEAGQNETTQNTLREVTKLKFAYIKGPRY